MTDRSTAPGRIAARTSSRAPGASLGFTATHDEVGARGLLDRGRPPADVGDRRLDGRGDRVGHLQALGQRRGPAHEPGRERPAHRPGAHEPDPRRGQPLTGSDSLSTG